MLDFRVLGPLEVSEDDTILDLGPLKQRSLLALLLMNANRVVSIDRILEEIWGEKALGKESSVWVYVSGLRSVLEPNREARTVLVTKDHGYGLQVDPDSIDAIRFEREAARGHEVARDDPTEGSKILRQAIEIWRGAAYQDFLTEDFARMEIQRLEELRLTAIEEAVEADLRRGKSHELIAELERIHDEHPLREGPVGQLMLALYRTGRSADALRLFDRFRRGIGETLGISPSPELCRLEEQVLLHDSRLLPRRREIARTGGALELVNPYKGLRPFREEDAGDYFGRDRIAVEVLKSLEQGQRLVALVGPSGSGKSSLASAGVIPVLRKGGIPDSQEWLIARMLPGSDPFMELEAALLQSSLDAPSDLGSHLRGGDSTGFLRAALRMLGDTNSRLCLVIDQFEELFTLVTDDDTRHRFLDHLITALDDVYGRVTVLVTLRANMYAHPFEHAEFGTRLGHGVINVVPLTPDELEAAALEPAARRGITLEPALLAELIADVIGQPGALPMFQYALAELFDRRVGDRMMSEVYHSIGGVGGALSRRADDIYETLNEHEQSVAKRLLIRLVTVTEGDDWSRRRVPASEIVGLNVDTIAAQKVIKEFADHRLLTLGRDPATGDPTIEVAHEALLREWERLEAWIQDNREGIARQQELALAAKRWDAAGRDEDYVFTGGRLEGFGEWARSDDVSLTALEQAFLDAGTVKRNAADAATRARQEQEQALRRTAGRRAIGMAAAVAALVVLATAVLWVATRSPGPRIALVQGVSGGEGDIQQLIELGWQNATRDLAFEAERLVPLIDSKKDMQDLAEDGFELIIDGLFDQGAAVYEIAEEYPDVAFVVFDRMAAPMANVSTIHFEREGGAYLMGVAAGLRTETGRIGFIGGMQLPTTEARRTSFEAGAASVRPDIVVDSVYLGPFHDSASPYLAYDLVQSTASDMYRSGIDVIHHSAGTAGKGIAAAADELTDEIGRELWVIGSEIEEQRAVPAGERDRFLTSMWKRWDLAVQSVIEDYLAGNLEPGLHVFDLSSGLVDFSTEGALSEVEIARLEEYRSSIVDGTIDPRALGTSIPRWTRTPDVAATVSFDGETCTSDWRPVSLAEGDVLEVRFVNGSGVPAGIRVTPPKDMLESVRPVESRFVAPDGQSATAVRLQADEGSYTVSCMTAESEMEALSVGAHFEASCDESFDSTAAPVDVVQAFVDANNERDPDAVCSVLADDAVWVFPGGVVQGGQSIAEAITPLDDALGFFSLDVTEIAEVDQEIAVSLVWRTFDGDFPMRDQRVVVEAGKIVLWTYVGANAHDETALDHAGNARVTGTE
ncbi:BMP family ABC transporter substrate-binding protein [Actinomycetota bacterium]